MSDIRQDHQNNNTDIYNKMSTEELERYIEYAFFETDITPEAFEEMMSVYNQRDGVPTVDTKAHLERFINEYSESEELFPYVESGEVENTSQTIRNKTHKKPSRFQRLKRLGIAAAVFVIISTIFLTSTTYGAYVWQTFSHWTGETFGFSRDEARFQINEELISLHEALAEHGITDLVAPIWLPDGFSLIELHSVDLVDEIFIIALLGNEDRYLTVQIRYLTGHLFSVFEKDYDEPKIYRRNEINHYIMTNYGRISVKWVFDNFECHIFGDITESDATRMIDSIYER